MCNHILFRLLVDAPSHTRGLYVRHYFQQYAVLFLHRASNNNQESVANLFHQWSFLRNNNVLEQGSI